MYYLGISAGFHDAAISTIDSSGNIIFAGHSERYSKKKHDHRLCSEILTDATFGLNGAYSIHYYERPWLKLLRQWRSGEKLNILNLNPINSIDGCNILPKNIKVKTHSHHLSHAAAGFQTSQFTKATVVVIDAIGEFDTITIWGAQYNNYGIATYKKLWSQTYPDSIGLFYSAMTKAVGLRPLDEEYILMGMAAYGNTTLYDKISNNLISDYSNASFKKNLHAGLDADIIDTANKFDIAASSQKIAEDCIDNIMVKASKLNWSKNLVYMGGVALNCLANRNLGNHFEKIWIMPNPGDAGSSLGAAALGYGKKLNWKNAYLGHEISGPYPVLELVNHLEKHSIAGVASGRAEFGPRALGNRSLLADPRGQEIKDRVNEIKRRQKFRPFAPVILEELADKYFEMPQGWTTSPYMQAVAKCINPGDTPAICHADGTSRVQTVPADGSGIRQLLEAWYSRTGCPMLLNTSLNIRGEPMVNDRGDAYRFEKLYGIKVFS